MKRYLFTLFLIFLLSFLPLQLFLTPEAHTGTVSSHPETKVKPGSKAERFIIRLKSRVITEDTPEIRIDELHDAAKMHIILQLDHIPSEGEREELRQWGVELLPGGYLHTNAWFASISTGKIHAIKNEPNVLWKGSIEPEDRLSSALFPLLKGGPPEKEWISEPNKLRLLVSFFSDVSEKEARSSLCNYETEISIGTWDLVLNAFPITIDPPHPRVLSDIISKDAVQWVEPDPVPSGNEEELDYSRPELEVDLVADRPYNLTGKDIPVMIYDSSSVRDTHRGFSGRVRLVDPKGPSTESNRPPETHRHATAVAGVICGDGSPITGRNLSGMAPLADLYSYWKASFNFSEGESAFDDAINERNVYISHNSWGMVTHGGGPSCVDPRFTDHDGYADYGSKSRWFDRTAAGALNDGNNPRIPLIVFSAGNQRDDGNGGTDANNSHFVNFGTINVPKTAKNVLVVGATYDDDGNPETIGTYDHGDHTKLYVGSNWGPCDDGRLKPELMAPGGTYDGFPGPGGDDNINTTDGRADDAYRAYLATSMAAPHVSGIAALLVEHYVNTHGSEPNSSALKALLIHGARDIVNICTYGTHLDGYDGPDYMTGYGQVRAKASVDIIDNDKPGSRLIREDSIVDAETHEYVIRAEPGDEQLKMTLCWMENEPGTPNDDTKELVNDLDLLVIDPSGVEHYPYTLDPSDPLVKSAVDSPDRLNNLEQVEIEDPAPGWWRVRIVGYSIPSGPQGYSLVSDHRLRVEQPPQILVTGPNGGETLNGTAPITWRATDPNLDVLYVNISLGRNSQWTLIGEYEMNDGIYYWNTSRWDDDAGYLVRIDAWDDSIGHLHGFDISNSSFTIYNPDPPNITLTKPVAHDILNGTVEISWLATDPDGDSVVMDIYMTSDLKEWEVVASGETNDGTYLWDTLKVQDGIYWLKINGSDSSPLTLTGESEAIGPVTVYNPDEPVVQLHYPNGGEKLAGLVEMNWSATDADGDNLTVGLFIREGSNGEWQNIVANITDRGNHSWNTSEVPDGNRYWIRVVASDDSPEMLAGMDESDYPFVIDNPDAPVISGLSMGDHENVSGTIRITWDVSDADDDHVAIDISWRQGEGEWNNIVSNETDIVEWDWDTGTVPDGENYFIRIVATDSSEHQLQNVSVTDPFSIDNPDHPKIDVTYPRGGETLHGMVNITWTAVDADGDVLTVDVEYSLDGKNWGTMADGMENSGTVMWDTGGVPDGETYRIRVKARDSSVYRLVSSNICGANFTVYNPDRPVVSMIEPSPGDVLKGRTTIRWQATDADGEVLEITIAIRRKGNDDWKGIAHGIDNDGDYAWDTSKVLDGEYSIKVTADDGLLKGEWVTEEVKVSNSEEGMGILSSIVLTGMGIVVFFLVCFAVIFLLTRRKKRKITEKNGHVEFKVDELEPLYTGTEIGVSSTGTAAQSDETESVLHQEGTIIGNDADLTPAEEITMELGIAPLEPISAKKTVRKRVVKKTLK